MRTLSTPVVLGIVLGLAAGMMIVTFPVSGLMTAMFILALDHAFNLNPTAELVVAVVVTYAAYVGLVSGIMLITARRRSQRIDVPGVRGF